MICATTEPGKPPLARIELHGPSHVISRLHTNTNTTGNSSSDSPSIYIWRLPPIALCASVDTWGVLILRRVSSRRARLWLVVPIQLCATTTPTSFDAPTASCVAAHPKGTNDTGDATNADVAWTGATADYHIHRIHSQLREGNNACRA